MNRVGNLLENRAIRNVLSLFLVNGMVSILGFLTQLTLANRFGSELYGLLGTYIALGTYFGTFVRFGRERTLLRDLVHYPDKVAETIHTTLWLSIGLFLLCGLGFGVCVCAFPMLFSLAMLLVIWGNVIGFFDLQFLYDYWRQMGRHAVYMASARLVFYAVVWATIVFTPESLSLVRVGLGMFLGYLFAISVQLRDVFRKIGSLSYSVILHNAAFRGRIVSLFRNNFSMMLLSMLDLVYGPAPVLLLAHFHGKSTVGVYLLATQFLLAGNLVLQQITRVGSPRITSLVLPDVSRSQRRRFLMQYILGLEAIAAAIAIPLWIFSDQIVHLFFRSEYAKSVELLPIFSCSLILIPISQTLVHYVLALRRDRPYVAGVVLTTCAGFCICLWSVQHFAAVGAAWSYFFTLLLGIGVNLLVASPLLKKTNGHEK